MKKTTKSWMKKHMLRPNYLCQYCGEGFIPARAWQRYCGNSCSNKAHRARSREKKEAAKALGKLTEIPAANPGSVLEKVQVVARKTRSSRYDVRGFEYEKAQRPTVERLCKRCEKPFLPARSWIAYCKCIRGNKNDF